MEETVYFKGNETFEERDSQKVVLNFDPELARPIINGMSTWDAEDFCRHIAGVTDDEQKLISDIFDEVEVEELLPDDDYDRDDVDYDEDDHHSAVSYENVDYDWDDYHRRAGENMHRLADFLTWHGFVVEDKSGYLEEYIAAENSVTPEYKNAAGKEYIEAVKKELPDFDGNIKAAATSVIKQWGALAKANPGTGQYPNRYELRKQALSEYLKDMGCDSPGKTFAFLEEKTGIKNPEKKLSLKDEHQKHFDSKMPDYTAGRTR